MLEKVVVYQQSAVLEHIATVNIDRGETTLLIEGLSSRLDSRSIQVRGDKGLTIASLSHSIDYLNKAEVTEEIELLEIEKRMLSDSLSLLSSFEKVFDYEKEMILANKEITGTEGLKIEELNKAAVFFRTRLTNISIEQKQLEKRKSEIRSRIKDVSKQLYELNANSNAPSSVLKIVVTSEIAGSHTLNFQYVVPDARWESKYDIRIEDVSKPLELFYKAMVFQNTGEDWNNVKLVLSTGNPKVWNELPILNPYYLTFNNYYGNSYDGVRSGVPFQGTVSGYVRDRNNEPLIGANILVVGTNIGVVTNYDGYYRLNAPQNKELEVSYTGYNTVSQMINSARMDFVLNEGMVLEEVVVSGSKSGKVLSKFKKESIKHVPMAIERNQVSTEFNIDIPYTIPSDNQGYDVTMIQHSIPAKYIYRSIPKLSEDAFLVAQITDWHQYELINGPSNLFYNGIYQGQSYIDIKELDDTLNLSIGRDHDILMERESRKDFSKKSIVGNFTKEQKKWEITLKNNKTSGVNIEIIDQVPVSKDSEIKIDQLKYDGANLDNETGKLIWNLQLAPKESKILSIQYEVKYPKKRKLVVE